MNMRRLAGLVLAIGLLMMPTTVGARRRAADRPTCRVTQGSGAPGNVTARQQLRRR
jgi:hypothetical protein